MKECATNCKRARANKFVSLSRARRMFAASKKYGMTLSTSSVHRWMGAIPRTLIFHTTVLRLTPFLNNCIPLRNAFVKMLAKVERESWILLPLLKYFFLYFRIILCYSMEAVTSFWRKLVYKKIVLQGKFCYIILELYNSIEIYEITYILVNNIPVCARSRRNSKTRVRYIKNTDAGGSIVWHQRLADVITRSLNLVEVYLPSDTFGSDRRALFEKSASLWAAWLCQTVSMQLQLQYYDRLFIYRFIAMRKRTEKVSRIV